MNARVTVARRIAALLLASASLHAVAQETPASTAPDSAAAGTGTEGQPRQLEEVTVTATKQVQLLEKVPASVTSLGKDFIKERVATNFQELTDYTANVNINVSGSAGQFVIRGLGTPDTNLGFDPSVGTVVDGVYYGRANFVSAFFNDLDRYEVLRGPQGTLFGKNSTAGLFNVLTNKPGKKLKFDGELLARGYGDISFRPALSVPIGENFGLRLSANVQSGDRSTLYNTYLGRPEENEEQQTFRARGRYASDAGLVIDFQAVRSHLTQNNSNFQLTQISQAMEDTIRRYDPAYDEQLDNRKNSTNFPSAEDATIQSYALTIEHALPGFFGISNLRAVSITAFAESNAKARNIDADFTPIPFINDKLIEPSVYKQTSQEIRFTGSGKNVMGYGHGITFITGFYYLKSSYGASDLFSLEDLSGAAAYCTASDPGVSNCREGIPGGFSAFTGGAAGSLSQVLPFLDATGFNNQNVQTRLKQEERTFAGFGQFEFNFLPKWALIGGVRYGTQRKAGVLSALASRTCPPGVEPGTPAYAACPSIVEAIAGSEDHMTRIERQEGDYSPKGGIRWSPSQKISSYFTWARGYKSGGFNGLPLRKTQNEFGPERAASYEIGAKAKLFKNRMRLGFAAFNTDFDDLQVSTFIQNRFIVLNAASANSKGAEMDFEWLPEALPFLMFRSSLGYSDARYRSYPNGPCYSDAPSSCTGQDLSGKRLPYGSKWTAAVAPNLFFPLGNGLSGTIGLDWIYRSDRYLDVDIDPRKLQGDTNAYNGFFIVTDPSKKWALNFAVRNISNIRNYDQIIGQPLAPGNFAAAGINEPRTFVQSISYSF